MCAIACDRCRGKKAKCDRGDVDRPNPGRCAGCERADVDCVVTQGSRKRRIASPSSQSSGSPSRTAGASGRSRAASSLSLAPAPSQPADAHVRPLRQEAPEPVERRPGETANALARVPTHDMTDAMKAALTLPADPDCDPDDNPDPANASNNSSSPWESFEYVKKYLLTAEECEAYVQGFYESLYELTMIPLPDYKNVETHLELMEQPLLCMAILAISSRFLKLKGHGAYSRGHYIHDAFSAKVTEYVNQINWGQRTVGERNTYTNTGDWILPVKGIRTLGTVEALLLLCQWNLQHVYLPQFVQGIIVNETQPSGSHVNTQAFEFTVHNTGISSSDTGFDPIQRSNRVTLHLETLAFAIANEAGVFSRFKESDPSRVRAQNIRRLIYVFKTQLELRMRFTPSISAEYWSDLFKDDYLRRAMEFQSTTEPAPSRRDRLLWLWWRSSKVFWEGQIALYTDKETARDIIDRRVYPAMLDQQKIETDKWRMVFWKQHVPGPLSTNLLQIEYDTMRVLENNIAFQAVIIRVLSLPGNNILNAATMRQCLGNDRVYIDRAVEGAQSLLLCIDRMHENGWLKLAPSWVYHRIVMAAIFLMKSFCVGHTPPRAASIILSVETAIRALRFSPIDDLHVAGLLGERIARLMKRVRSSIRHIGALPGQVKAEDPESWQDDHEKSLQHIFKLKPVPGCPRDRSQERPHEDGLSHSQPQDERQVGPEVTAALRQSQAQNYFPLDTVHWIEYYNPLQPTVTTMPPEDYDADFGMPVVETKGRVQPWVVMPMDSLRRFPQKGDVQVVQLGPFVGGKDMMEVVDAMETERE